MTRWLNKAYNLNLSADSDASESGRKTEVLVCLRMDDSSLSLGSCRYESFRYDIRPITFLAHPPQVCVRCQHDVFVRPNVEDRHSVPLRLCVCQSGQLLPVVLHTDRVPLPSGEMLKNIEEQKNSTIRIDI